MDDDEKIELLTQMRIAIAELKTAIDLKFRASEKALDLQAKEYERRLDILSKTFSDYTKERSISNHVLITAGVSAFVSIVIFLVSLLIGR